MFDVAELDAFGGNVYLTSVHCN